MRQLNLGPVLFHVRLLHHIPSTRINTLLCLRSSILFQHSVRDVAWSEVGLDGRLPTFELGVNLIGSPVQVGGTIVQTKPLDTRTG